MKNFNLMDFTARITACTIMALAICALSHIAVCFISFKILPPDWYILRITFLMGFVYALYKIKR